MALLGELTAALLYIMGAAALIWTLFGRLLRPRQERVWVVLPGEGDAGSLEEQVRWLAWCRDAGLFGGWVLVLDRGLTPQGRALALELARRWDWISCCPAGTLEEWLDQELE